MFHHQLSIPFGSNQFGDTEDDVHEFSGSLKIGNLTFSTSSIGIQSDTDLISLSDDTFTLNGSIVINDGQNIGIDSDTDLLDLNDQNLIINGKLDSTGRIDLTKMVYKYQVLHWPLEMI